MDKSTKDYLHGVWRLFTPPGTDMQAEIKKREDDPDRYEPPMRECYTCLMDRAVAWRSRSSSPECIENPDLLVIELLSAGDFLRICLPPGAEADWRFSEEQVALLEVRPLVRVRQLPWLLVTTYILSLSMRVCAPSSNVGLPCCR